MPVDFAADSISPSSAPGLFYPYRTIMQLLGCLFVFLFAGLLFVVGFAGLIIDKILVLLGLKQPRQPLGGFGAYGQQGRQYGPFGQQGQDDDFDSVDSPNGAPGRGRQQQASGHSGPQQGGKIFEKDDSEYVDFEEV